MAFIPSLLLTASIEADGGSLSRILVPQRALKLSDPPTSDIRFISILLALNISQYYPGLFSKISRSNSDAGAV